MTGELGRGINFGNALDAYSDPLRLTEAHFDAVRAAGIDTVRLPVRWSAHAAAEAPYTIDGGFLARADWAVGRAMERGLNVVLNVHHYDELNADPDGHTARFLGLWKQIASRYAAQPNRLYLELLNEPHGALDPPRWNELLAQALAVVRETNPDRAVIVGTARANDIDALPELRLPDDDRLIVTVHYYAPFAFTHQGATWIPDTERWLGTTWGTESDRKAVADDLETAARWTASHNRPLFLGEFGAYSKADMPSRLRWVEFVREQAERLGMSWAHWDFATDFGAYDPEHDAWRAPLLRALVGPASPPIKGKGT
ncbi:glycoside hydrolase family 5 protein [Phytohabitans aurantiacus]|uniref:glycoside hydrolase family 5 protein n=1 Tax=Phytohabitans aurantiacus TaxID=3016789 RepID=UPI002491A573|nr:glycoside hydrolase family 5 protein [Phytohabitans aurantiacus]